MQVAGTYADIKFADGGFGAGQHFSALFRCIVAALSDAELPVGPTHCHTFVLELHADELDRHPLTALLANICVQLAEL